MTATGKAAQIPDALLTHLGTLEIGSPPMPIQYPDVAFDPKVRAPDGWYLQALYFPNRPAWEGLASGAMAQGLLQVNVVRPKETGAIRPAEVVALVKAHFAKGTIMVSGATRVKVSGEPWEAQALEEPSRTVVPVTIPWTA